MRERLIELIADARNNYYDFSDEMHEKGMPVGESSEEYIADSLLKNGMIVPPCKVGDILYVISQTKDKRILPFIDKYEVTSISIKKKSIVIYHEMDGYIKIFKQTDFGKTVFLTQNEAEQALKEGARDD